MTNKRLLGDMRGPTLWELLREWRRWRTIEGKIAFAIRMGYKSTTFALGFLEDVDIYRLWSIGFKVRELDGNRLGVSWED